MYLQNNSKLIKNEGEKYVVDINSNSLNLIGDYTKFSDSSNKIAYHWHKSKNNSDDEFLAGNLGMYLGFVSEIRKMRLKNPNLNFGIAEIPRSENNDRKVYAKT
jgi:hypothetical protein